MNDKADKGHMKKMLLPCWPPTTAGPRLPPAAPPPFLPHRQEHPAEENMY